MVVTIGREIEKLRVLEARTEIQRLKVAVMIAKAGRSFKDEDNVVTMKVRERYGRRIEGWEKRLAARIAKVSAGNRKKLGVNAKGP